MGLGAARLKILKLTILTCMDVISGTITRLQRRAARRSVTRVQLNSIRNMLWLGVDSLTPIRPHRSTRMHAPEMFGRKLGPQQGTRSVPNQSWQRRRHHWVY